MNASGRHVSSSFFRCVCTSASFCCRVVKKLLLETPHQTAQHADSLEVLCTLLKTAGKQLDRPMAVDYMTHYFNTLSDLANHHTLPRIRFMVMDIIELRSVVAVQEVGGTVGVRCDACGITCALRRLWYLALSKGYSGSTLLPGCFGP